VITRPMLNHRLRTTDSEGEEVMELRYGQRRGWGGGGGVERSERDLASSHFQYLTGCDELLQFS